MPAQLIQPEFPDGGAKIWLYFCEMSTSERPQGMGISKIPSSAMYFWQWKTGTELDLWERKAIGRLDDLWYSEQVKDRERNRPKTKG